MMSKPHVEKFLAPYELGGQIITRAIEITEEILNRNVNTPDRIIKMDDLLKSTFAGFEDHSRLLFFDYRITRGINPATTEDFQASGSVKCSNITLVLVNNAQTPTLVQYLCKGMAIQEISVKDLMWTGGDTPVVRTHHVFGKCYLTDWQPGSYTQLFEFRPQEWLFNVTSHSQIDGSAQGNNETSFNFRDGNTKVELTALGRGERLKRIRSSVYGE